MPTRRTWTTEEDREFREIYPNTPTKEAAKRLNRSVSSVYNRADLLGIGKSSEYLASAHASRFRRGYHAGWEHRFKKGHTTHNKGLRRPGWGPGRMKATQFKAGNRPQTWKPVGTERLAKDGYLERKISDTGIKKQDWKGVHVVTWEEAHGQVPPGHAVVFKDGDKRNIKIENLELVSRRELMARNTVHRLPKELALTIQLVGALRRQLRKRTNDKEQDVGSSQPSVRDARSTQG